MSRNSLKIVSGGQTGVDRGALDAALSLGCPCGGWCPAGRRAEDGVIDAVYPLRETVSTNYSVRTCQNISDSDGTLVIYYGAPEGGTTRTIEYCRQLRKPCYHLNALWYSPNQALDKLSHFIQEHEIAVLNVAGPRASKQEQAEEYAFMLITLLLQSEYVEIKV